MYYVNAIPKLDGTNCGKWYQKLEVALAMSNIDLSVTMPEPKELENPVRVQNEADAPWTARQKTYETAWTKYDIERALWYSSNCKCLMIIKGSISDAIKMAITDCPTAAEYLEKVKS